MLFQDEYFAPETLGDDRTAEVLLAAIDRAAPVRPSDILHAAISGGDPLILTAVAVAMADGAKPDVLPRIIDVYNPPRSGPEFDGRRDRFSPAALVALDEFDRTFGEDRQRLRPVCLELLVSSVLANLDAEDRSMLKVLDPEAGVMALDEQIRHVGGSPVDPFDEDSGRLLADRFTEAAWRILEHSAVQAAELGYELILTPHCFLALLAETDGLAERVVRLQLSPELSLAKVVTIVAEGIRQTDYPRDRLRLHRDQLGTQFVATLRDAHRVARLWGAERIDTVHLLAAVLGDMPKSLASLLQREPLRLNLAKMRGQVDQALVESRTKRPRELPFRVPTDLLRTEDLTWLARTKGIRPAEHLDRYFDTLTRALHRGTDNHVLITGPRGVGTTSLVRELARRAASGEIGFLARKRFLWADCRDVPAAESGMTLTAIISAVAGRTDLILCLDGLGPILRGPSGANHKPALQRALKERRIHLIATADDHDYRDLLAADHALLQFCTRIEMVEPGREQALDMAALVADSLSEEFDFAIEPAAVERAVSLGADYILNERHPRKAANVLRRACEDLHYERDQLGSERRSVTDIDIVRIVSDISGLPETQLSGVGSDDTDYERELGTEVVGQEEAVAVVGRELRRIKANLTPPGKPASVLLFAGLTGVGKTELAKTLARFHSASKSLQTYTMGNFTEGHSVSGITGSPPGYVGYEQGGRLVNDLNSDPYCVFLLDEAEKAHPDVWKPFLNLFDEGWVVDQRGVKAFGDRAIFILTTNAGNETIARLSDAGRPMREIVDEVTRGLLALRERRSGEPIFSPEFVARIRHIVVFRPLDADAMLKISRLQVAKLVDTWSRQRGKALVVADRLTEHIAETCHLENVESGGRKGARLVEKKIAELIDDTILRAASRWPDEYRDCDRIELSFTFPRVDVAFAKGGSDDVHDRIQRVVTELRGLIDGDSSSAPAAERLVTLQAWLADQEGCGPEFLSDLRTFHLDLARHALRSGDESRVLIRSAIDRMMSFLGVRGEHR